MVKLNFINKKACLINCVLSLPNSVFHYFLEILDFLPYIFYILFLEILHIDIFHLNNISGKYSFKMCFFYFYNCIIRLEQVDILPFLLYNTELISVIWTMRWTLASCTQCCTLILI